MYSVNINEFEGPLDLLLHLIKQSNISIYDISIKRLVTAGVLAIIYPIICFVFVDCLLSSVV